MLLAIVKLHLFHIKFDTYKTILKLCVVLYEWLKLYH